MKLLLLLTLISCSTLCAQSTELWLTTGPSVLFNRYLGSSDPAGQAHDTSLGEGYQVGLRFDYNSSGHLGHELYYAFNHTSLIDRTDSIIGPEDDNAMAIHQGGYNLLYYVKRTNEAASERLFVTAGVHASDFVLPSAAGLLPSSVRPGFNVGVGLKFKVSQLFGARVELRQYETAKPDFGGLLKNSPGGLLHQTVFSVGFGVYF